MACLGTEPMDTAAYDATLVQPGGPAAAAVVTHNQVLDTFVREAVTEAALDGLSVSEPLLSGSVAGSVCGRSTCLPRVELLDGVPTLMSSARRRFEEGEPLGAGGLGEVVEAVDHDICRTVALKRMRPEAASDAAFVRFVDEIRTVGALEHPNIVPIYDVGLDDEGRYYFVMKRLHGETLEDIIEKLAAGDADYHRRYTFERRSLIMMGVLEAVQYAHAQGIMHRDIKPANIMVGPHGEVVLMDWGIAKRWGDDPRPAEQLTELAGPVEASGQRPGAITKASGDTTAAESVRLGATEVGALVGTPAYMSPEQALGYEHLDARSDVYSLCAVFYELLSLRYYLGEEHESLAALIRAVVSDAPTHPSYLRSPFQAGVPPELGWIVMKGLTKDPAERYASAAELAERLQRRLDGHIVVNCPVTLAKSLTYRWARFIDRHPMALLSMMIIAALLVIGGAAWGVTSLVGWLV